MKYVERQTRTQQKRIIDAAVAQGEAQRLYWFIEMRLPSALRPRFGGATCFPLHDGNGLMPVVACGQDAWQAYEWADLLAGIAQVQNSGMGIEFEICLTDISMLEDVGRERWYEWGEEVNDARSK